jgi:hypothetical protein
MKAVPLIVIIVQLCMAQAALAAVFAYQTRIITPPVTTSSGPTYTGNLFYSDNNDYIFQFSPVASSTKSQPAVIHVAYEGANYWDTHGRLNQSDNDTISMANFDFEIDIIDQPTGKTFTFPMKGSLNGSISYYNSQGQPYDGCTSDCYMPNYVSSISFQSVPNGGTLTRGNVMYHVSPQQQVVQTENSSAGLESYLDFAVTRTEFLPGDFNHDGSVTMLDYSSWRDDYGESGMGIWTDGNCNGKVDAADYVIWRNGFIAAASSQFDPSVSVPEPSAAIFSVASCCALLGISRRRRALI